MVETVDLHKLEEKYRGRWPGEFEADPSEKEKFYINVAFPYPSGAMHVGHGRTYTVPDIVARFWRMRGRQVLFPMGFHVTGTPVIGISK
ncbi:MAG TPA: class I tRNA ligase family protein, partial [Methanomicrobiales archaeon]|nr:class I tRNA ligase family protein [Methanomicrobiales archaeon]